MIKRYKVTLDVKDLVVIVSFIEGEIKDSGHLNAYEFCAI